MKKSILTLMLLCFCVVPSSAQELSRYEKPKFNAYIYGGNVMEVTDYPVWGLSLDASAGCRIYDFLYVGGELGIVGSIPKKQKGGDVDYIIDAYPFLAANAKFLLPIKNSRIEPFISISLGANLDIDHNTHWLEPSAKQSVGLYMNGGAGFDYRRLSVMMGYQGISTFDNARWGKNIHGDNVRKQGLISILFLKIGIRLGK